jgi:hypothetical protein
MVAPSVSVAGTRPSVLGLQLACAPRGCPTADEITQRLEKLGMICAVIFGLLLFCACLSEAFTRDLSRPSWRVRKDHDGYLFCLVLPILLFFLWFGYVEAEEYTWDVASHPRLIEDEEWLPTQCTFTSAKVDLHFRNGYAFPHGDRAYSHSRGSGRRLRGRWRVHRYTRGQTYWYGKNFHIDVPVAVETSSGLVRAVAHRRSLVTWDDANLCMLVAWWKSIGGSARCVTPHMPQYVADDYYIRHANFRATVGEKVPCWYLRERERESSRLSALGWYLLPRQRQYDAQGGGPSTLRVHVRLDNTPVKIDKMEAKMEAGAWVVVGAIMVVLALGMSCITSSSRDPSMF